MAALARSYSEFGWLLDSSGQQMVKEAIQNARSLPAEESSIILLEETLGRLEDGAAKLASAMFSAPDGDSPRARGRAGWDSSRTDLDQLLKSALESVEPKKT
jgi:hypothetical protein